MKHTKTRQSAQGKGFRDVFFEEILIRFLFASRLTVSKI